jgi:ribosomal protein L11 methyltransferase
MSSSILPSENWHSRWMKNYRSFRVEPFLIRPSWEAAQFEPGLVEVVMDPKGAFGTGTHETSQMCLKYLPRVVAGRRSALDLGCGSGILSIALCKLAARLCVLALDNDFQACQVCRDNREINDVRFSIACGEISTTRGMFDLIVANLQMDLLLKLLPDFLERTLPGAILVLSGLLGEQIDPVRHLYDNSLRLQHLERQGDWAAVVYSRP